MSSALQVDEFGRRQNFDRGSRDEDEEARLREKLRRRKQTDATRADDRDRDRNKSRHDDDRRRDHREHERDSQRRDHQDRRGTRDDNDRNDNPRQQHHHHEDRNHDGRNDRRGNVDYGSQDLQVGSVLKGRVVRIESYGAFVQLYETRNATTGLVHISQLASRRVEQVQDVVQMNQEVYVQVLELEGNNRIRLGMAGVDQETGRLHDVRPSEPNHGRPMMNDQHRGGGRYGGPSLDHRAKQRQDEMRRVERSWEDDLSPRQIPYLRELWSASPEPPTTASSNSAKAAPKRKRIEESNDESSSDSESSSSSSEDSRRRSRSKHRRKSRSGRKRSSKTRKRRRSYSSSSSSSESSSSESSSASAEGSRDRGRSKASDNEVGTEPRMVPKEVQEFKAAVQGHKAHDDSSDEDDGPQPLPLSNAALNDAGNAKVAAPYGQALLPGEGQAIAQFVQQNLRVPRRGEIGVSQDAIEQFENSGYVMSGSRHAKMNAVRLRKENQVYSAEEQRALALITMEEKQQKEAALMEDFRQKLKEKQAAREAKR